LEIKFTIFVILKIISKSLNFAKGARAWRADFVSPIVDFAEAEITRAAIISIATGAAEHADNTTTM
jgi:hypothetical protein